LPSEQVQPDLKPLFAGSDALKAQIKGIGAFGFLGEQPEPCQEGICELHDGLHRRFCGVKVPGKRGRKVAIAGLIRGGYGKQGNKLFTVQKQFEPGQGGRWPM